MRLLVTGGAGFIGSHFIQSWLRNHPEDDVVNLDLLTYAGSLARLDTSASSRYRFVQGDVCVSDGVRQVMQGVHVVVHFAAETHVDRSITNARPFLRSNVEGSGVLLKEALDLGVQRFIHISTDEVYGQIEMGSADETALLQPRSPYAASKAGGDLLAQSFHKTYGLPVIIVRPSNIYGPAQLPEKFIPLCITRGLEGLSVPIYGDGQQQRAWLFVKDFCDALEVIMERAKPGSIYNVASHEESTNLNTARMIFEAIGQSTELLQHVTDRPAHDRRYALNDSLLRSLGWSPRISFAEGLKTTIRWYREHVDWWRPLAKAIREDSYHWLNGTLGSSTQPASQTVL